MAPQTRPENGKAPSCPCPEIGEGMRHADASVPMARRTGECSPAVGVLDAESSISPFVLCVRSISRLSHGGQPLDPGRETLPGSSGAVLSDRLWLIARTIDHRDRVREPSKTQPHRRVSMPRRCGSVRNAGRSTAVVLSERLVALTR